MLMLLQLMPLLLVQKSDLSLSIEAVNLIVEAAVLLMN